jgi:hypothetical protein
MSDYLNFLSIIELGLLLPFLGELQRGFHRHRILFSRRIFLNQAFAALIHF